MEGADAMSLSGQVFQASFPKWIWTQRTLLFGPKIEVKTLPAKYGKLPTWPTLETATFPVRPI
jgi:hypothetical protein